MNKNFKNYTALMHVLLLTTSTCFASGASDDPDEGRPSRGNRSAPVLISKKTKAKKASKKREIEEPKVVATEPPVAKKAAAAGHVWKVLNQSALSKKLKNRNGSLINASGDADATSCCFAFLSWVKTGQLTAAVDEEISMHNDANVVPGASVITIGDQRYDYQNPAAQKEITFKPSSTFLSEEPAAETKGLKLEKEEIEQIKKIFNAIPLKDGEEGRYASGIICLQFKDGADGKYEIKAGKISGDVFNFYIYKKPGDDKPVVLIIDPIRGDTFKLDTFINGEYPYKANFHVWFEEDQAQAPEQPVEQQDVASPDFQLDSDDFFGFEDEELVMPAKKRNRPKGSDLEQFQPFEENKREKVDQENSNSDSIDARAVYGLIQDNTEKTIKGDKQTLAWLAAVGTADAHYDLGQYYYNEFTSSYDPKRSIKAGTKAFFEAKKYLSLAVNQNHRDAAKKLAKLYFQNNMDTAALKVLKDRHDEELLLVHLDLLTDVCLRSITRLTDESGLNSALQTPDREVKLTKKRYEEAESLRAKLAETLQIPVGTSNKLSQVESFFNKEADEEESQSTRQSAQNQDYRPIRKRPSSTDVIVLEKSDEVVEEMAPNELSRLIDAKREIAEKDPEQRDEALEWLSNLAEKGSSEAQLALAIFYNSIALQASANPDDGDDVLDDLNSVARMWLEFAAGNGHKRAIYMLKQLKELEKQPLPQVVSNPTPQPVVAAEKRVVAVEPIKSPLSTVIREQQPLPQAVSNSSPLPVALVEKRVLAAEAKQSAASSAIREMQQKPQAISKPSPQQAPTVRAVQPKEINLISDESPKIAKALVQSDDPKACLEQAKKLLHQNKYNDGLELLHKIIREYADKKGEHSSSERILIKKQAAALYIETQITQAQTAVNDQNLLSCVDLLESIANGHLLDDMDPSNQLDLVRFKQTAKKALSGLCVSRVYLNKVEALLKSGQADLGVAMLRRSVEYKSMQATLLLSDHYLSQGPAGHNQAFDTLLEAYQGSTSEIGKQKFLDKILQNTAEFQSRILALTPALCDIQFCLKIGEKLLNRAQTKDAAFAFLAAAADKGSVPAFMCMVNHHKKAGKESFGTVFNLILDAFGNMASFDSKLFCPEAKRVLEELGDGYANQPQHLEDLKEAIKCYEAAIKMTEQMNAPHSQTQVKNKLGRAHLTYAKMILNGPTNLQQAQSAVESLIRSKEYCFILIPEANQLLHTHALRVGNDLFSNQDQTLKVKAIEFVTHLANLQNGDACYWLGRLYMEDQFGSQDLEKAKHFMTQAVAQRHGRAHDKLALIEDLILKDKFETAVMLSKSANSMHNLETSEELLRRLLDKKSTAFAQKDVLKYLGIVHDAIGQLKWNAGGDLRSAIFSFQQAIRYAGPTRPDGSNREVSLTERRFELGLSYFNQQPMTEESLTQAEIQFKYVKREVLSAGQAATFKTHLSSLYFQHALLVENHNKAQAIFYLRKAAAEGNLDAVEKLKGLTGR